MRGQVIFLVVYCAAGTDELGLSESGSGSITTYLEGSINYNQLFAEKTSCRCPCFYTIIRLQTRN